jgi:cyclic pyranopterin phosphate synthase
MCDVWKQPNGIFDQTDFWSTATEKIFPYLKEIDVLGGEPFVQKDSFRLIREISRINPDCTWAFVTNGNYNFIPVAKHLDQVHLRWIQLSLDASTEKTYLEVRKGGGFQLVLRTLQLLTEYREVRERMDAPFDLSVSFCVQRGNWLEIPGFLELCQKFNVHPIFQLLFEPTPLSLLTLPEIEKKKIATFLEPLRNEGLQSAILNPLLHSLTEERKQSPRDLNFPS